MKVEVKPGRIQVDYVYLDHPRHDDVIVVDIGLYSKYPGRCGVALNGDHIVIVLNEREDTLYLDDTMATPTEIWLSDLGATPWDWRVFTDASRYHAEVVLIRQNTTQLRDQLWPPVEPESK